MIRDRFRASVQYNDFKGSAAADRADRNSPEELLRQRNLISAEEFIVGIEIWAGENPGVHEDPISVSFFVVPGAHDSVEEGLRQGGGPFATRRVQVDMPAVEFLGLFKRFSVAISPSGMLVDKSYSHEE